MAAQLKFLSKTSWAVKLLALMWSLFPRPPRPCKNWLVVLVAFTTLLAPEVVPQCSIKPLPLGRTQGQYIAPYQEPFVLPSECPSKRNKLNIEVFQSGKYPITRNLFVVVKQNSQTEQQAGVAYANLLLIEQGQELINRTGFVKIR